MEQDTAKPATTSGTNSSTEMTLTTADIKLQKLKDAVIAKGPTHCRRGHKFTPGNTQWSTGLHGKPQRGCKKCKNLRRKARYQEDTPHRIKERHKARRNKRLARLRSKMPSYANDNRSLRLGLPECQTLTDQ